MKTVKVSAGTLLLSLMHAPVSRMATCTQLALPRLSCAGHLSVGDDQTGTDTLEVAKQFWRSKCLLVPVICLPGY